MTENKRNSKMEPPLSANVVNIVNVVNVIGRCTACWTLIVGSIARDLNSMATPLQPQGACRQRRVLQNDALEVNPRRRELSRALRERVRFKSWGELRN